MLRNTISDCSAGFRLLQTIHKRTGGSNDPSETAGEANSAGNELRGDLKGETAVLLMDMPNGLAFDIAIRRAANNGAKLIRPFLIFSKGHRQFSYYAFINGKRNLPLKIHYEPLSLNIHRSIFIID